MILLWNNFRSYQKIPQRDVSQVQIYLIVTELSQNFDYNVNLSRDPPIHLPRNYVKLKDPHIDQSTLAFDKP